MSEPQLKQEFRVVLAGDEFDVLSASEVGTSIDPDVIASGGSTALNYGRHAARGSRVRLELPIRSKGCSTLHRWYQDITDSSKPLLKRALQINLTDSNGKVQKGYRLTGAWICRWGMLPITKQASSSTLANFFDLVFEGMESVSGGGAAAASAPNAPDAPSTAKSRIAALSAAKLAALKAKLAHNQMLSNHYRALCDQGHGPQRHDGRVTNEALDKRTTHGIDPMSGKRWDAEKSKGKPASQRVAHGAPSTVTKINDMHDYARTDLAVRNSDKFQRAAALSRDEIRAEIPYTGGPYTARKRVGNVGDPNVSATNVNFSQPKAFAIYRKKNVGGSSVYHLKTMYITG